MSEQDKAVAGFIKVVDEFRQAFADYQSAARDLQRAQAKLIDIYRAALQSAPAESFPSPGVPS